MLGAELIGSEALEAGLDAMPATILAVVSVRNSALSARLQAHVVDDKLSGQVLGVRTGALRQSIQLEVEAAADTVTGRVFSSGDVKYAAIHEYGGVIPAHEVYPSKARALSFLMGGKRVFARHASIPDIEMPERSFLRSSLADMAAEISAELKAAAIEGAWQSMRGVA